MEKITPAQDDESVETAGQQAAHQADCKCQAIMAAERAFRIIFQK